MVYYDLNFTENSTNLYQLATGINSSTDGLFAGMFLLSLYIIVFMSLKMYDTKTVFLVDSFVVGIVAIIFWTTGFIGINILIYPLLLLFAAILIKAFSGD